VNACAMFWRAGLRLRAMINRFCAPVGLLRLRVLIWLGIRADSGNPDR
jgi:hypothetical protein